MVLKLRFTSTLPLLLHLTNVRIPSFVTLLRVNTTTIAANIKGYNGPTPLKIYISNNKIEKIEALPNDETPKYFFKVKKEMLEKWNGMTVNKAVNAKIDGVTGATISSDCVSSTVKAGLEYYKKNKK